MKFSYCSAVKTLTDNNSAHYLYQELDPKQVTLLDETTGNSMAEKYNYFCDNLPKDTDIAVFIHDDVAPLKPMHSIEYGFEHLFNNNKDLVVAGAIGSPILTLQGQWHSRNFVAVQGGIVQEGTNNKRYTFGNNLGTFTDTTFVDGLVLFIRADWIRAGFRFDTTYGGYHFYDLDTCMTALKQGKKVGVYSMMDFLHRSEGNFDAGWAVAREKFVRKWTASYEKMMKKRLN